MKKQGNLNNNTHTKDISIKNGANKLNLAPSNTFQDNRHMQKYLIY